MDGVRLRQRGEADESASAAQVAIPQGLTARSVWVLSCAISALVTTASVLGLAHPHTYEQETANWAAQARGQDIGNLLAVAVLLLSAHGCARRSHHAAMVWLGTLLYLVYAYAVYSVAVHFNQLFLVYVAVLGLSAYAVMFSVNRLRAHSERQPASQHHLVVGPTLIAIGMLFAMLWLSELLPATVSGEAPPSVVEAGLWVNPIHVIDLAILLPAMIIAGWQTAKGRAVGRFFAGPLLVFAVLMGTSIVAAMVLMTVEGFEDTLPPLLMVSLVVLASLFAAWRHLSPIRTTPVPPDQ